MPSRKDLGLRGRTGGAAPALLALAVLSGCSDAESTLLPHTPEMLRPVKTVDHPSNAIEQALSRCPKRFEAGETACLQEALAADKTLTVPGLIALIPGCRTGRLCSYDYTTDDHVGYLASATARFVVHWRAAFDFSKAPSTVSAVPVKVVQI